MAFGADVVVRGMANAGGVSSFDMSALNKGWCARFTAPDTRDVASVYVNWSAVTAGGTVQVRIETIDATTGKPTGTLYDASASLSFTPVAGWQILTFASLPTTGLTAGTEYGVVLLTTTGGTNHALRSHTAGATPGGAYPTDTLTATDGTTRSNFAESGGAVPVCTLVMEDSVEEILAMHPFATLTNYNLATTAAAGMKFVVPTGLTFSVLGVDVGSLAKVGTPAGDLRGRILNSSDAAVSGTTITVDKDSLITGVQGRRLFLPFVAPVSLSAGTYRLVFDSSGSANTSNCWRVFGAVARAAGNVPSSFIATNTSDVTAGTISWTDTATEQFVGAVIINDIPNVSAAGVIVVEDD